MIAKRLLIGTSTVIGLSLIPCFGGTAFAQESNSGAFASLSPGNQIIAQSLYDSQSGSGGQGATPWTLDRISSQKTSGNGWGDIFHQMKADGLIAAKNLGQVVSQYYRNPAAVRPANSQSTAVGITTAGNATVVVGKRAAGGDRASGKAGSGATSVHGGAADRGQGTNASGPSFAQGDIATAPGMAYGQNGAVSGSASAGGGHAFSGLSSAANAGTGAGGGSSVGAGHGYGR